MSPMSSEQYEVVYTLRSETLDDGSYASGEGCFLKYRQKGKKTAAVSGLLGASAMAGVWKLAALRRGMGITGMIIGGVIGAGLLKRTSGIQRDLATEMLQLPEEKSQRAAQAREILQTKLPHNAFAQELLKESGFAMNQDTIDQN